MEKSVYYIIKWELHTESSSVSAFATGDFIEKVPSASCVHQTDLAVTHATLTQLTVPHLESVH